MGCMQQRSSTAAAAQPRRMTERQLGCWTALLVHAHGSNVNGIHPCACNRKRSVASGATSGGGAHSAAGHLPCRALAGLPAQLCV